MIHSDRSDRTFVCWAQGKDGPLPEDFEGPSRTIHLCQTWKVLLSSPRTRPWTCSSVAHLSRVSVHEKASKVSVTRRGPSLGLPGHHRLPFPYHAQCSGRLPAGLHTCDVLESQIFAGCLVVKGMWLRLSLGSAALADVGILFPLSLRFLNFKVGG